MIEMYEIRFCRKEEMDKLQLYIKDNININESLANNSVFFNWFFGNKTDNYYNCLLAVHKESNQIHGFFGILPIYAYDSKLFSKKDIWVTNFSVKSSHRGNGIGNKLIKYLLNSYDKESFGSPGISDMAFPMFKKHGFKTGYLNHYYILNNELESYSLIGNVNKNNAHYNMPRVPNSYRFLEVHTLDSIHIEINDSIKPSKSIDFVKNRYSNHPLVKYRFFVVNNNSTNICLLVIRKVEVNNSSCLRIVDIVGNYSSIKYIDFEKFIKNEQVEYIDCYNYGVEERIFYNAGFIKKEGKVIVPDHFEPFEKRNIPINYAYKYEGEYIIFKGDGSLDRPR